MSNPTHPRTNYVAVYGWLVGLLILSVLAVYLPFPQAATVTIIFIIAAAKAALVAAYFMHMRFEKKLIYSIAITPVILFIILTVSLIPDIVYK